MSRTRTTSLAAGPMCPSWCAGHDATSGGWTAWVGGTLARDHNDAGTVVAGIAVRATQIEVLAQGHDPARVWVSEVSSDIESQQLTAAQARELAAAILAAADRIEAEPPFGAPVPGAGTSVR